MDQAVENQRDQRPPEFVDPSLILLVNMHGLAMESDWEALGLTLLSTDDDNNIVLFSSSDDLRDFRSRLEAYDGPIPDGQAGRRFEGFVNRIGDIRTLEPRDRLGTRLKEAGFAGVEDFRDNEQYTVDIELWEFGPQFARLSKAEEINVFIDAQNGEVFDIYAGPSITLIRARAMGRTIRPILSIPEVAFVDIPPKPDLGANEFVQLTLDDVPQVAPIEDNLPLIAILDSGVNDHPFLQDAIFAREAFPDDLGEADALGHGTAVSGIATMGDLRRQLEQPVVYRSARLISAKVVTDDGQFYERQTLPTQMRGSIERIHGQYGCRIFVIALGDVLARSERGRVGSWATTLDELVRELNILIFVSAGNRSPRGGNSVEQARTHYPGYLLEEANRICEPAGAANAVTVGSLAHSNGIEPQLANNAHFQHITEASEPSPFTRTGPGAGGIKKPDFVDFGGTLVFDAIAGRLQSAPHLAAAGLITTNNEFFRQLFVSKSGTSFSTPMLANKAARLLRQHPNATANLLKSLMAGAAQIPEECNQRLAAQNAQETAQICGNGLVDTLRAAYSDDHRVVLFAQDQLEIDQFAVYSVPIPREFQGNGCRTIRVSLAYDPPVKRTRAEYTGVRMNFRLIRGCPVDVVFAHFRTHAGEESEAPDIQRRCNCHLKPGPNSRDKNTIQTAAVTFTQDTVRYGNEYHLVVRCIGGWASDQGGFQNFAVVVELEHQAGVQLFAQLRQRIRV